MNFILAVMNRLAKKLTKPLAWQFYRVPRGREKSAGQTLHDRRDPRSNWRPPTAFKPMVSTLQCWAAWRFGVLRLWNEGSWPSFGRACEESSTEKCQEPGTASYQIKDQAGRMRHRAC